MTPSYSTTTRFGVRYAATGNKIDDFAAIQAAMASDITTQMTGWGTGLDASKGSAGIVGRFYKATDSGILYFDDGSRWKVIATLAPARGYASAATTIATGSWNLIKLGTASFDDDHGFNLAGSGGYYVCPRAGKYAVSGQVNCATSATSGNFAAGIWGNSGAILSEGEVIPYTGPGTAISIGAVVSDVLNCAQSDTIGLAAFTDQPMTMSSFSSNLNHLAIQPLC